MTSESGTDDRFVTVSQALSPLGVSERILRKRLDEEIRIHDSTDESEPIPTETIIAVVSYIATLEQRAEVTPRL